MLITPPLLLLLVLVGAAFGAQIPLLAANVPPSTEPDILWDLERPPSVNATGHLVFLSVGSLLQHWPNTLYRNGMFFKTPFPPTVQSTIDRPHTRPRNGSTWHTSVPWYMGTRNTIPTELGRHRPRACQLVLCRKQNNRMLAVDSDGDTRVERAVF